MEEYSKLPTQIKLILTNATLASYRIFAQMHPDLITPDMAGKYERLVSRRDKLTEELGLEAKKMPYDRRA